MSNGRCVAAITAAVFGGTSWAKTRGKTISEVLPIKKEEPAAEEAPAEEAPAEEPVAVAAAP